MTDLTSSFLLEGVNRPRLKIFYIWTKFIETDGSYYDVGNTHLTSHGFVIRMSSQRTCTIAHNLLLDGVILGTLSVRNGLDFDS